MKELIFEDNSSTVLKPTAAVLDTNQSSLINTLQPVPKAGPDAPEDTDLER